MGGYKRLFDSPSGGSSPSGGGTPSGPFFEPGTYGAYWWTATKVIFWVGVVIGILQYGHQGIGSIFAVVIVSAALAPLKALFWAFLFWVFAKLFG